MNNRNAGEDLRSSYDVKIKASDNAFTNMYICPTSAHRGFRYAYRRCKIKNLFPNKRKKVKENAQKERKKPEI
jgi:hypothetical protein